MLNTDTNKKNYSYYLDLGFDIFDGVGGLDFQGNGLAGQRFHEDLHLRADLQI